MNIFESLESNVRSYSRSFPTIFEFGKDYQLIDINGRSFIDFFSGAGALNYGHNPPTMKAKLLEYISKDGITHSLDMATTAKKNFLESFNEIILTPRHLEYKIQFTGPTGTNSIEAAIKLARKITGRKTIIYFTNAFHGMTLGSLSLTDNPWKKAGAGIPLEHSLAMPFDGFLGDKIDTLEFLESFLKIYSNKSELPAAIILETIQAEGGVNVAELDWLKRLAELSLAYNILLIVDDIQVGCGRTGCFFSFELAGIKPDIICLSKSLSAYGLPLAIVLLKPELDIWNPGEHNGTFRGNNLAIITATEALNFWRTNEFSERIHQKSLLLERRLKEMINKYPKNLVKIRGRGLLWGIDLGVGDLATQSSQEAFKRGLVIETAGRENNVLKVMPPLIIDESGLNTGLSIIEEALALVFQTTEFLNYK